jgi:hypothetical protein
MTEALLTALGLVLGVAATVVALLQDEKPSMARRILCLLALIGLGVGLFTTYRQYKEREQSDEDARRAKEQLQTLVNKVGNVQQVQALIDLKTADLTMLNDLGGGDYYVVIDTFLRNSSKNHDSCEKVTANLLSLYPDLLKHRLLWTAPVLRDPSHYQLRFGRNLTPSSAAIFQNLAKQGLSNGNATIWRSGSGSPSSSAVGASDEAGVCPL